MQPQFVGPSYNLESRPASVQRTVNMVPVPLEPGNERAGWGFEDVPGLVDVPLVDQGPAPDPDCVFTEAFDNGKTDYTTIIGNDALFTIVPGAEGDELNCASQNTATEAIIRRDIPGGPLTATHIKVKFRVDADAADDAATFTLRNAALGATVTLTPRRESAIDPNRACHFIVGGNGDNTGAIALTIGDMHHFVVEINNGVGTSTWEITNLATATLIDSGTFASDMWPGIEVDSLEWYIDKNGQTCETTYDTVCVG